MPTAAPPAANPTRQAFYDRLAPQALAPLWEAIPRLVTPEPRPSARAHVWRWNDVRPFLMEAGTIVTAEEAERRVLILENPAFLGQARATATMFAGIQMVLPGEIAPAHRHSHAALRFVIESEGGYTTVDGERAVMEPGDFVLTSSWRFHDHGNPGASPVAWLDIVDVPIISFFEGSFAEKHTSKSQTTTAGTDLSQARYGHGMLPLSSESSASKSSPILSYPYRTTRAALAALAKNQAADPVWAHTLKYTNPLTGDWAMPTIASWMTYLAPGFSTLPTRSTDGLIVAVVEGHGTVDIGGTKIAYGPKDVLVVPNWTWRSVSADETSVLFFSSDRGVQEKLGLWRQQINA